MKEQESRSNPQWVDEAQFYLQGMSMENSLLQSYRMIFGAMEAILFAAWFGPTWNPIIGLSGSGIVVFGVVVCIGWIVTCVSRGAEVTAWRKKITKVTEGTRAEGFIKERFEPKSRNKFFWRVMSARVWLSLFLPLLLIALWSILASGCSWVGLWVSLFLALLLFVLRRVFKIDLLQL